MNRSELRLCVGIVLGVVVPVVVLEFFCPAERLNEGLTATPFAWRRILIAHLTAAVPFGLACGAALRSRVALGDWFWAVLGIAAAAGVGIATPHLEGAIPSLLLRSGLAILLVTPWCLLAIAPSASGRPGWLGFAAGVGLAVIPSALYGDAVMLGYTKDVSELIMQRRVQRANGIVTGLHELGSERSIGTRSPAVTKQWIAARLTDLRREADRPLPTRPSTRIDRAIVLVELERLDAAADLLAPIVPDDEPATRMLAAIETHRQRWTESDALYRTILDRRLGSARTDPFARESSRTALLGMAENARLSGRFTEEEDTLRRGVTELPQDAARFHFLLGRHYHATGRNALAMEELQASVQLDSDFRIVAEPIVQQIRTATPSCLSTGRQFP